MSADPKNPGDRAKASKFRKRLRDGTQPLDNIESLWLAEYEETQEHRRPKPASAADFGAARSARTVKLDIQEEAQSIGTGTAAAIAAGAALAAKEEGRRLDSLTINAVDALKEACHVYRDICISLRERTEVLEATHVTMLESVRGHFLARTEAEAAAIQNEGEDPINQLVAQLLPHLLKQLESNGSPRGKGKPFV